MKVNKIEIILILIVTILLLGSGKVKAALQSNPNTQYTKTDILPNWVSNIRKMEATGGAMGLSETIESDLTASESNGIDVHCIRTTEYGAIAILSASGYGNPSNNKAITTTTGNNTGVMLNTANYECTVGIASASSLSGVNARYYDLYTTSSSSAKPGDALVCSGWHNASYYTWPSANRPGIIRGRNGIFSFGSSNFDSSTGGYNASRAVAVCGAGL